MRIEFSIDKQHKQWINTGSTKFRFKTFSCTRKITCRPFLLEFHASRATFGTKLVKKYQKLFLVPIFKQFPALSDSPNKIPLSNERNYASNIIFRFQCSRLQKFAFQSLIQFPRSGESSSENMARSSSNEKRLLAVEHHR